MSRRTIAVLVAFVVSALVVASFALADDGKGKHDGKGDKRTTWTANLIGYNEVPATNSKGHASLSLALSNGTITFKLEYSGLSGNPAAAHVHIGQVAVNGGVSFFFCGGGGKPACPASTSGTINGTVVAADVVGPTAQGFAAGDLDSVLAAIQHGLGYANMHTANFPGGEIRGQLRPTGHGFGH
ncbi:MAG TPA: CHRD domain-containing protein [Gaiellaceae bacterium]|jgi:CHRD domain|nr:CHRD domain-containing protein [Gaiellaceae bacterium]